MVVVQGGVGVMYDDGNVNIRSLWLSLYIGWTMATHYLDDQFSAH